MSKLAHRLAALFVSAAVVFTVGSASASANAIDANSYVTKGLIAQWDGIDNAGAGSHASEVTDWIDLVGGVALSGEYEVGESVIVPKTDLSCTIDGLWNLAATTVETFSYRTVGVVNGSGFIWTPRAGITYTNSRLCMWLTANDSVNTGWAGGYFFMNDADAQKRANLATRSLSYVVGEKFANDQPKFYYNGVRTYRSSAEGWTTTRTENNTVSIYSGTEYHTIRIYNRVLSDDEVAYNAAVDQVRFNGADPATTLDTLSFRRAADGGLEYRLVLDAGEDGTFVVNGEDVGATAELWYPYGTVVTNVFQAKAGLVRAIVVTPDQAEYFGLSEMHLSMTTGFKVTVVEDGMVEDSPLGPDAYVQSGLIAQFDAWDNQGFGVCATNAHLNSWVDRMGNCDMLMGAGLSFEPGWAVFSKVGRSTTCSRMPGLYTPTTLETFAYASEIGYSGVTTLISCGQNISLWWQNGATAFGACAPIANDLGYYGSSYGPFSVTPFSPDTLNTWTVQSDGNYGYMVYLNGTNGTFANPRSFWSPGSITFSKSLSFGNGYMKLKARSLRLYSRQLSAAEVAFNAAVDNIRFRGATFPDDLPETLPDGVRLNANRDGLEVRVVAKVEDGTGLVSMNGETAAASNECWVAAGTEIALNFAGNAGMSVGEWQGAPSVASSPTRTSLCFKAHGALSIVVVGKAYSENPIMSISEYHSGGTASFGYSYSVPNAGGEAKTVTLRTIYGQDANRLCYTNDMPGVIGEGGVTIGGLIHSRDYYFKVIAFNDEGKSVESELMSIKTTTPNDNDISIYNGKYGTYDSRQPVVKGLYGVGLQESLRLRGPITAPAGTRLVVHYGLTADIAEMESVDCGSECIANGAYSMLIENVPVGTIYVILEAIAGNANDYFHAPATGGTWKVPSYAVVAKEDTPSMHPAAVFTGSNYLQVRGELPRDTFANDFTMSVWVKNPRGISDGDMGQYDLRRQGYMMGCGTDGSGATGPMIAMRPYNWTHDTDAEWQKNPQWSLCATYRDSASVNWIARMDPTPERDITCDDKWHHIIMVCSETEKRVSLYLDLELIDSVQSDSMKDFVELGSKITFSGLYYAPGSYGHMIGMMAEATVWRKALNEKERRLLHKNKFSDDDPALVGHWLGKDVPLVQDTCLNQFYPVDIDSGSAAVEYKTKLYIPVPGMAVRVR